MGALVAVVLAGSIMSAGSLGGVETWNRPVVMIVFCAMIGGVFLPRASASDAAISSADVSP